MRKNKFLLLIGIVILLGIIISITLWIKKLNEDSKESLIIMNEIKEIYQSFEKNIDIYNETRTSLATYLEDSYIEELPKVHSEIISLLSDIEKNLQEDESIIKKLDERCPNKIFQEKEVNNICNSYQIYYEKLVNIYVNDTIKVNKLIGNYNQDRTNPLPEYTPKIKEYIDYNKDSVYSEREEL